MIGPIMLSSPSPPGKAPMRWSVTFARVLPHRITTSMSVAQAISRRPSLRGHVRVCEVA